MATWKEPKNDYKPEDQVTPEIFNTLAENERYLQEVKITTDQVQNAVVNSTEATTRTNILDGDTIKAAFGKLRKWFADFGTLAFKSVVETADIAASAITSGKIASNAVTSGKIASGAVTDAKIDSVSASKVTGLAKVATSGSYNDLSDKPDIGGGSSGTGKVVWEGSIGYFDSHLNFQLKAGYKYAVVIKDGGSLYVGEGIAMAASGYAPKLSVIIPGHCYAPDHASEFYILTLEAYDSETYYNGGARYYTEGYVSFEDGWSGGGYIDIDGQCPATIVKIIEYDKVI